ncbi:MAG: YjjG family noncanonical pyrimidine nucleotidase [Clostridia bacterium]|nr:YjjG family noncanonical pyrimidine nucleotidase [Clostridia bacterium]
MYTTLLFDVDDTLLDFGKTEYYALNETLKQLGLICTDEIVKTYNGINVKLWEKYQKGEITKKRLVVKRFELLAERYGFDFDACMANEIFISNTSRGFFEIDGAKDALIKLKEKYDVYAVTNALLKVSTARLKGSGFYDLFLKVFNSDQIGASKPNKEFFDVVFREINEKDKSKILIVGDSLSSDILGGINNGIDTAWVNPNGKTTDLPVTITVKSVSELINILL